MSHSTAQASSAAAPLDDPPARPPATGMDFLIDRLTPSESYGPWVRASSWAARTARLDSSWGTSSAPSPVTLTSNSSGFAHAACTSS